MMQRERFNYTNRIFNDASLNTKLLLMFTLQLARCLLSSPLYKFISRTSNYEKVAQSSFAFSGLGGEFASAACCVSDVTVNCNSSKGSEINYWKSP